LLKDTGLIGGVSLIGLVPILGANRARLIDLYYQEAYTTRMKITVLCSGNRISLASFTMDSLCFASKEMELLGLFLIASYNKASPAGSSYRGSPAPTKRYPL
jgi:hypothetical protein